MEKDCILLPAPRTPLPPIVDCVSHSATRDTYAGGHIAVFPILADAVDVKRGDQLCETVFQPSIQPDKVVRPMGS